MSIRYLIIPVCIVLAGCTTTGGSPAQVIEVNGAQNIVASSRDALNAYQLGNKVSWEKLVCNSPLSEWDSMRTLVGDISDIRILMISGPSDAGNSSLDFQHPRVAYQVTSSRYPLNELLLKFGIYDGRSCLNLSY